MSDMVQLHRHCRRRNRGLADRRRDRGAPPGPHPGRDFSVTLIESPNVPIIGVGEGTWPTLRTTLEKMGVSETDLFRHCDAAFKQGARFARWTTGAEDDGYYHPLMLPQGFTQVNLVPHWLEDEQGGASATRSRRKARCATTGWRPRPSPRRNIRRWPTTPITWTPENSRPSSRNIAP